MQVMNNWSTDEKLLKENYPRKYEEWRLLQLLNYGLDGEKLNKEKVKSLWPKIRSKIHDRWVREYLTMLLE